MKTLLGRIKIGMAAGFVLALLTTLCEMFGLGEIQPIQFILRFLGGPPAYLAWQIGRIEWLAWVFFFVYWMLVGMVFGLLFQHTSLQRATLTICFLVLLAIIHRTAQIYMNSEVELVAFGLKE
ncbi:MAG: hypothetical protein HY582_03480 [Candidatus Omnitrophica bacterium]|nr:hypothetical protein [Candidatus Omnitrophota bacterium]